MKLLLSKYTLMDPPRETDFDTAYDNYQTCLVFSFVGPVHEVPAALLVCTDTVCGKGMENVINLGRKTESLGLAMRYDSASFCSPRWATYVADASAICPDIVRTIYVWLGVAIGRKHDLPFLWKHELQVSLQLTLCDADRSNDVRPGVTKENKRGVVAIYSQTARKPDSVWSVVFDH